MEKLLLWLDPYFILPYRIFAQPESAYISGTAILSALCVFTGVATQKLAQHMHAKRLAQLQKNMRHYHELGEKALLSGDKDSFRAVNKLAHEAFGYHFSLSGAFFVASLWPVPLILAWMHLRFGPVAPNLPFSLPFLGNNANVIFWFLLCYIPLRVAHTALLHRLFTLLRWRAY